MTETCSIAPRTHIPDIDPSADFQAGSLGSETAADQGTVDEITETAAGMVACMNAGEIARYLAYFTDRFMSTGRFDVTDKDLRAPAEPLPEDAQVKLLGVFYVRQYASGAVGAIIALNDPRIESPVQPMFLIFTRNGKRWQIDAWPDPFSYTVDDAARVEPNFSPAY